MFIVNFTNDCSFNEKTHSLVRRIENTKKFN